MLYIKRLVPHAKIPVRSSIGAAGVDLSSIENTIVEPRSHRLVKTGLSIQIPLGTYGRVAPRSGLALKHGIDVMGGVIDSDFRGEIGVILFNHTDQPFKISEGDRIAQLIIEKILVPEIMEVDSLNETQRGSNGYGSSGI